MIDSFDISEGMCARGGETGVLAQVCNCAFPLLMSDPRCAACTDGQRRPPEGPEESERKCRKGKRPGLLHVPPSTNTHRGTQSRERKYIYISES